MTQKEVDEVLKIMRNNMNKVLERDDNLSGLEVRADHLDFQAEQLGQTTRKIKKKYWWSNMKYWVFLGVLVAVLIVVIILASVL